MTGRCEEIERIYDRLSDGHDYLAAATPNTPAGALALLGFVADRFSEGVPLEDAASVIRNALTVLEKEALS
ncbi:MAG: hypothetical protein ACR65X_00805 [Methylocystis sp.]